jgi:hypothetical protein
LWCFPRQISGFPEIPENVRTVSRDGIFPEIPQGFSRVRGFTAVATYKICKISRFWVFSGTDFPISEILEFRKSGTHCAFRNFGISEIPDPENPVFTETALQQVPLGISGKLGFQISEISGTLYTQLTKFPKI